MFKVRRAIKRTKNRTKNRGSATVELCFIMPVIIGIVMLLLSLFTDTVMDAKLQEKSYSALYTYAGQGLTETEVAEKNGMIYASADFDKIPDYGVYGYEKRTVTYRTEYDVCTARLRRWQLYGDVLWE